MIKLFSVKEKQKADAAAAAAGVKKQSPGELRLAKDLSELNLPPRTLSISFPNSKSGSSSSSTSSSPMEFDVIVTPDEGPYVGGVFVFAFVVPPTYPHAPPRVTCRTLCYHPNIDLQGKVCLNILREDWKPVLSISSVIYGLLFLFLEPNAEDPLNAEAASVLREDPRQFGINVRRSMQGGYVGGTHFQRCLKN